MKRKFLVNHGKNFIIVISCLSMVSCISYRPIFDPNQKYKTVGEKIAQADSDVCMKEADEYLKASKKRRIVKEGARGAGWGSIIGGIFGFLVGGNVKGLAVGVASGAGIGAVSSAGGVAAEDNLKPDVIKQRYVIRCLGNKGYEVIGWE